MYLLLLLEKEILPSFKMLMTTPHNGKLNPNYVSCSLTIKGEIAVSENKASW